MKNLTHLPSYFLILPLYFLILSLMGCESQEGVSYVEGLHYQDGRPVRIEITDGLITGVRELPASSRVPEVYVAPGLIDLQVNGYAGVDFSDQALTPAMMHEATAALWKAGVTTFLPTVITRDHERLARSFALLAGVLDNENIGASIPGFHLEGPYISPVAGYRGAHPEEYVRLPDWEEFTSFQELAHGAIKIITVAPEMDGALPFIRRCSESGVTVSLGHHNAGPDIIEQAVEAGASFSTHLGNGCANEINRHHNPLWPQLANEDLSITIICDGAHLTREEVRTFYAVKGNTQTILVSDALSFAGLTPGSYEKDGVEYLLTGEVVKFPSENVLAGAVQPVSRCVSNIMEFTGCSLGDAITMASSNPARLAGLDYLGTLETGKRADLILFTLGEDGLDIRQTLLAGEVVYSQE
jgi:N-acetylglucosamine-6-phosphate deacetylase